MAFRRFTEVSLMMRSEVGVTGRTTPAADMEFVPDTERVALTDCFESLLADRDSLCFFIIA